MTQMSTLPVELLEKILLDCAIRKADPVFDNNSDVYHDLAVVCRLWKDIIDSDHFRSNFLSRLKFTCRFQL